MKSPYACMYLVTQEIYEKLLTCIDTREKNKITELNENSIGNENGAFPNEPPPPPSLSPPSSHDEGDANEDSYNSDNDNQPDIPDYHDHNTSENRETPNSDDSDDSSAPNYDDLYNRFKKQFLNKNTGHKDSTSQNNPNTHSFHQQNFNNSSSSLTSPNITPPPNPTPTPPPQPTPPTVKKKRFTLHDPQKVASGNTVTSNIQNTKNVSTSNKSSKNTLYNKGKGKDIINKTSLNVNRASPEISTSPSSPKSPVTLCLLCGINFDSPNLLKDHFQHAHSDFFTDKKKTSKYVKWGDSKKRKYIIYNTKRKKVNDRLDIKNSTGILPSSDEHINSSNSDSYSDENNILSQSINETTTSNSNDDDISVLKCKLCPFIFNNKNSLIRHLKNVHYVSADYINNNPKGTKRKTNETNGNIKYSDSANKNKPSYLYKCKLCEFTFSKENALKRHEKNIHEIGNDKKGIKRKFPNPKISPNSTKKSFFYKCKLCSQSFSKQKILNRHLSVIHDTDPNYKYKLSEGFKRKRQNSVNSNNSLKSRRKLSKKNEYDKWV